MSPTRVIEIPQALMHQRSILADEHRFKVADCGRQWAKTWGCGIASLIGHGRIGNDSARTPQFKGAVYGARGWWIVPNYKFADSAWRNLKSWLIRWPDLDISETHRRVIFPNGGFVAIRTADDPEGNAGDTLDFVIVDEAAKCKEGTWEIALPTLSIRHGWGMMISTPKGVNNWFYREWLRGQKDHPTFDAEYASWQRPSFDNPLFTAEEDKRLRSKMGPLLYRREVHAEFETAEGSIFQRDWFKEEDVPEAEAAAFLTVSIPYEDSEDEERHTVVGTWHETGSALTLADLWRGKPKPSELAHIVASIYAKSHARGIALAEFQPFWSMCREAKVSFPTVAAIYEAEDTPEDEVERAIPASCAVKECRMKFRKGASWIRDLATELCAFPDVEERGMVETVALAARARPA